MNWDVARNNLARCARSAATLLLPLALLLPITVMAQVPGFGIGGASSGGGLLSGMPARGTPLITNSSASDAGTSDSAKLLQKKAIDKNNKFEPKISHATVDENAYNEFQDFVAQSVGRQLPMYGYSLFGDVPDTFAPVENISVTPDYLIGPGDEIIIKTWGQVDIDFRAVVNRNGAIALPKVGSVNVAGIRYQELQSHLKSAIGRVFRNFELNVTLGELRSIQVFVVGHAKRPGGYTVSSLSTLVNTLFASGGPSVNGSLRNIQVKRNGVIVTEFDMYDLLLKGDKTQDISLLPGDVIYIPPVGQQVAVYGGINTPAIYELKHDKTSLSDLLEMAGGLITTAAGQKVLLERIQERKVRKVDELKLDNAGLAHLIKDGDLVKVFSIGAKFDNAVTLRGNVAYPGRYPWKEGVRVKDLIPDRESLIVPGYWFQQNQAALVKKDLIPKKDLISEKELIPKKGLISEKDLTSKMDLISEKDSLIVPGYWAQQNQAARETIEDEERLLTGSIRRGKAEINWDYALVERLNKDDLTTQLIPFNLRKAISEKNSEHNLMLQAGDSITIFSQKDIQVPIANRSIYVRLEGEVANAGVYQIEPGETLLQLVVRVGGLTADAYLFGAEFNRESVRVMQQKKLNQMIDKMEDAMQRNLSSQAQTTLNAGDLGRNQTQAVAQTALIERLRKTQATGRVVLEISPNNNGKISNLPDLALEDGDRLMVPAKPATVSVMGVVYNENSFLYRPGKRVGDYLEQAGGPTRDADAARMYLLRSDGTVLSAQNYGSFFNSFSGQTLQPGDAVIVPEMLDKFVFTREFKDWTQIFFQFALGVTSLKVLGIF